MFPHVWLFVFLANFVGVSHCFSVEEAELEGCFGFLWRLHFQVPEPDYEISILRNAISASLQIEAEKEGKYYALYWPEVTHVNQSLDPHSYVDCIKSGGKQKLKSRVLKLKAGVHEGMIPLYRCVHLVSLLFRAADL